MVLGGSSCCKSGTFEENSWTFRESNFNPKALGFPSMANPYRSRYPPNPNPWLSTIFFALSRKICSSAKSQKLFLNAAKVWARDRWLLLMRYSWGLIHCRVSLTTKSLASTPKLDALKVYVFFFMLGIQILFACAVGQTESLCDNSLGSEMEIVAIYVWVLVELC